jgi:O-antigen biosynthesis protein
MKRQNGNKRSKIQSISSGKSIVVVLGMPRSGVSVITLGLHALGVHFCGQGLTLGARQDDEKLFEKLNDINHELGRLYEQNNHNVKDLGSNGLIEEKYAELNSQAMELLSSRLERIDSFGLNFPILGVLPFWQKVFAGLNIKVKYVIVLRNPLSLSDSWDKFVSLPKEMSLFLWLEYIQASLFFTQGTVRIVVDYDDLLDQPQTQMSKMALALGLQNKLKTPGAIQYVQEFVDVKLRHSYYKKQDIIEESSIPMPVRSAVRLLEDAIKDELIIDAKKADFIFAELSKNMSIQAEALDYDINEKLNECLNSAASPKSNDTEKSEAYRMSKMLGYDENDFKRTLTQRTYYQSLLDQNSSKSYKPRIGIAKESKPEQEIIALNNETLKARDNEIRLLQDEVASLKKEVEIRNGALYQANLSVIQFSQRLKGIHRSIAWRLLTPLRLINSLISRFIAGIEVSLFPLEQLAGDKREWQSVGDDPQFLLISDRAWSGLSGWYWLELKMASPQPLKARLYFDVGHGFGEFHAIDFQMNGKGLQRIPIFIPDRCNAIRFDPCDHALSFKLVNPLLKKIKGVPKLSAEFLEQANVYEALGGREGNVGSILPKSGVSLNEKLDYCWQSDGMDPWFELKDLVKTLRLGWYVIEVRIASDVSRGNAKIYFDYGEGYNEACSVEVPFKSGRLAKRFYKLSKRPKNIRFDPVDCKAKFSIKSLRFEPVLPIFAYHRMLTRYRNHSVQNKSQSLLGLWLTISVKAKKDKISSRKLVWDLYNNTFISNQLGDNYDDWIISVERPEFDDLMAIRITQQGFRHKPKVSVIMPTYNTPKRFLRLAIESVLAQSYPNWELCIADDASPDPSVRRVIEEFVQRDPRIKVTYRNSNGHISAASNSALELATGEFVALLDHDDELAPHALHFMVEAINQNPSAQLIYSDEDKIDQSGRRVEPHFKTDWNPDLLFSQNYVSHLSLYRRDLMTTVNGFRIGVEGSQDHDLLLRCLPYLKPKDVLHIPKVLYHWRIVEGSTALAAEEKSYTADAAIKALRDYFDAQGNGGIKIDRGLVPNTYKVCYPIPKSEPLVSLLIPTRDMLAVLKPCIDSIIQKTTYQNYEIIILDNGSVESSTLEYFAQIHSEDKRVKVIPYDYPFNYSAINNFGVKQAKGEVIGLINNDVEVISPEWLTEMVSHALRPEIGCVGAKLYYDDDTIQHAGVILGLGGVAGHSHKYFPRDSSGYFHRLKIIQNLSAVTAACLVVRKAVFEQVGGLEEEGLRIAFNDVDFCLKVREAGYRNLWTPYAELYHHESKSRGAEDTAEKIERFNKEIHFIKDKWRGKLQSDPYYSRNLTLAKEDFSL